MVSEGKVFSLGAEGNLFCLDAATGSVVWSRDFKEDYKIKTPVWGFAGNPLLDGNKLICLAGGSNSTVVALDKNTGREIWRALSAKEPGYCSPVIFQAGGVAATDRLASRIGQLAGPGDGQSLLVLEVVGGDSRRHDASRRRAKWAICCF